MERVQQWGIDFILSVQQIQSPLTDNFFHAITYLGGARFLLFLIIFLIWCFDYKAGVRLIVLYALSFIINITLKDFFALPRPFEIDPNVKIGRAGGYGFPSGHAQESIILLVGIAACIKKRWFWYVSTVLIVLIGFSRVYLGVHFPTDVLAGWVVGLCVLAVYFLIHPKVEARLEKQHVFMQTIVTLAVPPLFLYLSSGRSMVAALGIMAGVGFGAVVKARTFHFDGRGPVWMRCVRCFVGIAFIFGFLFLLRKIPFGRLSLSFSGIGILFSTLIGLWISLGAPWLFRLLRLAPSEEVES